MASNFVLWHLQQQQQQQQQAQREEQLLEAVMDGAKGGRDPLELWRNSLTETDASNAASADEDAS